MDHVVELVVFEDVYDLDQIRVRALAQDLDLRHKQLVIHFLAIQRLLIDHFNCAGLQAAFMLTQFKDTVRAFGQGLPEQIPIVDVLHLFQLFELC